MNSREGKKQPSMLKHDNNNNNNNMREETRKPVILTYDPDVNSLYIKLEREGERKKIARSFPIDHNVYFDLDDEDNVLGIEVHLGYEPPLKLLKSIDISKQSEIFKLSD